MTRLMFALLMSTLPVFAGVEKKAVVIDPSAFQDIEWKLQVIDSLAGERQLAAFDAISLRPAKDGQVSGSAGCNSLMGRYEVGEAGTLSWSDLGATKRLCDRPLMVAEAEPMAGLRAVHRLPVEDGHLTLHEGESGVRWVFAPAK